MATDLSHLALDSMWATSQAGGNRQSSSSQAYTAAGSPPVDPEVPKQLMADPHVSTTSNLPLDTDGKPQASSQAGAWKPAAPQWGPTTVPDVLRAAPDIEKAQNGP
jgi:hypothetical protein